MTVSLNLINFNLFAYMEFNLSITLDFIISVSATDNPRSIFLVFKYKLYLNSNLPQTSIFSFRISHLFKTEKLSDFKLSYPSAETSRRGNAS